MPICSTSVWNRDIAGPYWSPGESKGTLLTYRNNFVPASEPRLADNKRPTLRQARLNGPGSQHTLSHYAVSSPSGHIQSVSESPRQLFPVIQQRPLFSFDSVFPRSSLHVPVSWGRADRYGTDPASC